MEKEKANLPDRLVSPDLPSLPPCPVLRVLRANEFGLVIESNRAFDIGEAFTIGFHLTQSRESTFVSAESLVVDSRIMACDRGEFRHRVTLLFVDIAPGDRARLLAFSQRLPLPESSTPEFGLN